MQGAGDERPALGGLGDGPGPPGERAGKAAAAARAKNLRRRRCLPAPIRGPSVLPALKMELNSSKINLRG